MAYNDLREWIKKLDREGELVRIREEVDPLLEIAEITDRASKAGRKGGVKGHAPGGPALLFERVKGYPGSRVLMNQFGSERRMRMALETDSLDDVAGRIQALLQQKSPDSLLDKLKLLPRLAEVGRFFPKTIPAKQAACKEVILRDNFNVLDFPVLQCWPMDGGRYITLPLVVTRDPVHGKRNMGMYRMQVYDSRTTGMHWQRQKVAAEHVRDRLRREAEQNAQGDPLAARVQAMAETAGGTIAAASLSAAGMGLPRQNAVALRRSQRAPHGSRSERLGRTRQQRSQQLCRHRQRSRSTSSPDSSGSSLWNW